MASNHLQFPAASGKKAEDESVLELLREISRQLAEQTEKLSLSACHNPNENMPSHSNSTESGYQPRNLGSKDNIEGGKRHGLSDGEGSNTEDSRIAKNAFHSACLNQIFLGQSSYKRSAIVGSDLNLEASSSFDSLIKALPTHHEVSQNPPKAFKTSINRQGKPPNLAYLFKIYSAPDEPDPYEAAPRVLVPKMRLASQSASALKKLDDLRLRLGEFRHMPYDNRLLFPPCTSGPLANRGYIEAATEVVEAFTVSGRADDVTVFDHNELFGCHKYTFRAHESTGHMRPISLLNQESRSNSPWSRLIVCWSLPERPVSENLVIVKEYISPLHSIFLQSRDRMNRHPGSRESCASTNLGFVNFDVYAFRLTQGNVCSSIGKDYGLLHDQESQLFLEAYGLHVVADEDFLNRESKVSQRPMACYTALLSVPETFPAFNDFNCPDITRYSISMQIHILDIVGNIINRIGQQWCKIVDYMGKRFGENNAFHLLHHEEHDQLLFDDATFSRSRQYFWAISAFEEFATTLTDTVEAWVKLRKEVIDPFVRWREENPGHYRVTRPGMGCSPLDPKDMIKRIESDCEMMTDMATYFKASRLRIEGLRIALFNASAVMETRAATQLGTNMKLLTYVSVFYLPLSFCATLWNINGMPGLSMLALTSVIIAVFTYLAVFNLNNIVDLGRKSYKWYKKSTIQSMRKDHDPKWTTRAKNFEYFRPRLARPGPTNWLLPVYSIRKLAGTLRHQRPKLPETQGNATARPNVVSPRDRASDPKAVEENETLSSSSNSKITLRSLLQWASKARSESDNENTAAASDGSRTGWFSRKPKKATSHPEDLP